MLREKKYYLSTKLKCRDPLSYYHSNTTFDHIQRYIGFLKLHDIKWIELQLHFPIMWCPSKEENEFWDIMQSKF